MTRSGAPVAVVITCFNHADCIARAIQSVLSQSLRPAQVIVVDDGSSDGSRSEVLRFVPEVELVAKENGGVASSRNAGVSRCRQEWVAFLDGDDVWADNKIQRCCEMLSEHGGDAVALVHDVEMRDESSGEVLSRSSVASAHSPAILSAPEVFARLLDGNFVWTVTQFLARRSALENVGHSDVSLRVGSDYDLYLRLARVGSFVTLGESLAVWYQRDGSASGRGAERRLNWLSDQIACLERAIARERDPGLVSRIVSARRQAVHSLGYFLVRERVLRGPVAGLLQAVPYLRRFPELSLLGATMRMLLPQRFSGGLGAASARSENEKSRA